MSSGKLWTRRKCLHYSGLEPHTRYSLPIFIHRADFNEIFFTDSDGKPLPCCRDYVYEALDHGLFWLDCTASESGQAISYVHLGMANGCGGPRLSRVTDVVALCESFCGGRSSVLRRWELCSEESQRDGCIAVPQFHKRTSTETFQPLEEGGIGLPPCKPDGEMLWIEPGQDSLILRRSISVPFKSPLHVRVHLRAHFHDDGEPGGCHCLRYGSTVGEAAIGLPPGEKFYGYLLGPGLVLSRCTELSSGTAWQRSFVPRSVGWHTFELIWEERNLHVMIDGEPIDMSGQSTSCMPRCSEEVVSLYSNGKGYGVWAGVEVLHTPVGQSTWAAGVQEVRPGDLPPWSQQAAEEEGYWQDAGAHVIQHVSVGKFCKLVHTWQEMVDAFDAIHYHAYKGYTIHPAMMSMLGGVHEIVEEHTEGYTCLVKLLCPDGFMRFFPPAVYSIVHTPRQESSSEIARQELSQNTTVVETPICPIVQAGPAQQNDDSIVPAPPAPVIVREAGAQEAAPREPLGLALQCWTLPSETDIERIQRVVAHFLGILEGEGVAIPENIRLVAPCKEASHQRCFVYRFGTRRLHFAARAGDDGRLELVVRCGGGFMDFLDFARRHGALERIRLQRQLDTNGTGTVRLSCVRADGRVRVREGSPMNASRPSVQPKSPMNGKIAQRSSSKSSGA